jgi:hypothetical protein
MSCRPAGVHSRDEDAYSNAYWCEDPPLEETYTPPSEYMSQEKINRLAKQIGNAGPVMANVIILSNGACTIL